MDKKTVAKLPAKQIFPIWRQVYEDKIKELETGVHHG